MSIYKKEFFFKYIYKDYHDTIKKKEEKIERFGDNIKYINAVTVTTVEKKNKKGKTLEEPLIKEWLENITWQNKIIEGIKELFYSYENRVIWIPTNYWLYFVSEITDRGVPGYLRFLEHGLSLKKDIVLEYNRESPLISISNKLYNGLENENLYIYTGKSRIPKSFYKAALLTVYYTVLFILISLLIALIDRRLRIEKNKKNEGLLKANLQKYFCRSFSCYRTKIYIVLEHDLPGVDTEFDAFLFHMMKDHLGTQFIDPKLKDLYSFYSAEPDEMAEFFNAETKLWEKGEKPPTADELWPVEWFSPGEGLVILRTLIEASNDIEDEFRLKKIIKEQLSSMEKTLKTAGEQGIRWHLELEFPKKNS